MPLNKLKRVLSTLNLPHDSYSINRDSNESLCLITEPHGYVIYYSEKGQRTGETWFINEEEACQQFMVMLRHMLGLSSGDDAEQL